MSEENKTPKLAKKEKQPWEIQYDKGSKRPFSLESVTKEMFEYQIAREHFAVRFAYLNGVLLGFDWREAGQGWSVPPYYNAFHKMKALHFPDLDWEKDIEEVYYYHGVRNNSGGYPIENIVEH